MKSKITFLVVVFSTLFAQAQLEFEEQVVIDGSRYVQSPNGVTSADFDGDGDKDVLASSYFGNKVVWLENLDGTGNDVALHLISSTVQAPWGVYTADLDGDGDMDALAASFSSSTVTWYENTDGQGTFVQKQAMYAFQAQLVIAADMDNDGDKDLIWASKSDGTIKGFKNTDGLGNFGDSFNVENNVSSVQSIYPADIDGDGDQDILSCYTIDGGSQGVTWYRNNGTGSNYGSRILISNAVSNTNSVYAGDLDGDGDMDVASASGVDDKIAWYKNLDGLGTFGTQQVLTLTADGAQVVRITDVDADGDKDVVFGSNTDKKIGWFNNLDGQGNFSSEILIGQNTGDIRDIYFSDMDADGDLDFLTAGLDIRLFNNTNNTGSFTSSILTKSIDGGRVVSVDDLDGDGDKDIAVASYWDDKISWYRNLDGQGNYYNTQTIISTDLNGATSVRIGDVDGDGFKDVLATAYLDNTVVWFRNTDGLGHFAAPQSIDTNLNYASKVYLSDIDNDGDMDVFAIGTTRTVWYENLDGVGGFSAQQTIDNINNFAMFDMDFGDLDGDGDLDISVAGNYGMLRYINLDGQGTFGTRQILENNTYKAFSTKIADFDGDGDNDLVYIGDIGQTSSNSYLGWSKNLNGLGSFGPIQIISTLFSYPKSVIVADLDNDGDKDIASASAGTGTNSRIAWYENTDGLGGFANTQQIISQSSYSPNNLVASDIDDNGTLDIVAATEDDKVLWYKNSGILPANSISGTVRFDLLGDGCTGTDALLSGLMMVAEGTNTTEATFTQENGQFQLYTREEGTITTRIASEASYYAPSPATFVSNFTGQGNTDVVDFCVQPIGEIRDLAVSIYPTRQAVPGFNTYYNLVYRNAGLTLLSGSVTFAFDDSKLNFLNASEPMSSQTANTITFDFTGLRPFESRIINLAFNVFTPPTTNINDVLISTATINPVAVDFTPGDNVFEYQQTVIGSYDPNDITCLEGSQVLIEDADQYLHYLVRFQNHGYGRSHQRTCRQYIG
ncbi:MAG: VCBS repeat-containing protein [Flavobacterium sp. JAD_PAG50586_2]|nr:MAG: VCBS repeat-containing protein [Flavobacterium sp. JAD_PAG50586_2]